MSGTHFSAVSKRTKADFIFWGRSWWPEASILSAGGKQEKEIIAGRKEGVEKWQGRIVEIKIKTVLFWY